VTHEEAETTLATERYLLGEMTVGERDAFEEHFFSCTRCADDVRAGAVLQDGVRAGLAATRTGAATKAETAGPPRVLPFRTNRSIGTTLLPWAVAATLALVAGYQALVVVPGLRSSGGPLALAPTTLRPATRGAEAVAVPDAGGRVTLAIDLGSIGGAAELAYSIADQNGAQVVAGRVAAPADGAPLLLLVPAGTLSPSQHYVLTVKDLRNPDLTGGDYRFTVGAR
jgi:anti-sigma factor RsiW